MSRFFAEISEADLEAKIRQAFTDGDGDDAYIDHSLIIEKLGKDLKVSFDFENFYYSKQDWQGESFLGLTTFENGLTFWGMQAGGDWEHPVFFLIYWDGKKLRGYVPTEGNPWNTTTKQAFGNDDEADLKNAKKRWPESFKDAEEIDGGDFEFDIDAIRRDIMDRIQPQLPHKTKEQARKTKPKKGDLQGRIEALTYYGTRDEGYELFQQTCSYCYSLVGLGQSEKAEVVCGWAEEMAADSKEWWDQEMGGEPADTAKGPRCRRGKRNGVG